jgi:hypothetical protein
MKATTNGFKSFATAVMVLPLALVCWGCAGHLRQDSQTPIHGPVASIALSSTPAGARVLINSAFRGFTPVFIDLSRKKDYEVALLLDGYEPYSFSIKHKIDYAGWIIGNILFGGGIGLVSDAATGKFYNLHTNEPHPPGKGVIKVKLKPVVKTTE